MENTFDLTQNGPWKPALTSAENESTRCAASSGKNPAQNESGKMERMAEKMQQQLTKAEAGHVGRSILAERKAPAPTESQNKNLPSLDEVQEARDTNYSDLRQDYFIDPDCRIWQNPSHFCFNSDSVDLAKFVQVCAGMRILEIGANNGALLVWLDRFHPQQMVGIEILEEPAKLARLNLSESACSEWQIFQGPVQDYPGSNFDLVFCNPPFFVLNGEMKKEAAKLSLRQQARFEKNLDLPSMIAQANRLLKSNGRFCFVHRPERLSQAIVELNRNNMALSRLQILYDKRDMEPKAILVEAIKEGTCDPQILSPLYRGHASGKDLS